MTRSNYLRSFVVAIAGVVAIGTGEHLGAVERDFKGHIEFLITGPYPGPFAIRENQAWYSKVEPLGQVGGWVTVNVTTTAEGVNRSGNILLQNAKGDSLYLYYEVFRPSIGGPGQGSFIILSGTGKYQNAAGGGAITQYYINSNATDFFGRISY